MVKEGDMRGTYGEDLDRQCEYANEHEDNDAEDTTEGSPKHKC